MKGKREALAEFRDVYAKEISSAWPEFEGTVKEILEGKVGEQNGVQREGNGANGSLVRRTRQAEVKGC